MEIVWVHRNCWTEHLLSEINCHCHPDSLMLFQSKSSISIICAGYQGKNCCWPVWSASIDQCTPAQKDVPKRQYIHTQVVHFRDCFQWWQSSGHHISESGISRHQMRLECVCRHRLAAECDETKTVTPSAWTELAEKRSLPAAIWRHIETETSCKSDWHWINRCATSSDGIVIGTRSIGSSSISSLSLRAPHHH